MSPSPSREAVGYRQMTSWLLIGAIGTASWALIETVSNGKNLVAHGERMNAIEYRLSRIERSSCIRAELTRPNP